MQVYSYEHGDGVGNALDLILQGFIHAITMAAVPVVVCAGVLYLLVSHFIFIVSHGATESQISMQMLYCACVYVMVQRLPHMHVYRLLLALTDQSDGSISMANSQQFESP